MLITFPRSAPLAQIDKYTALVSGAGQKGKTNDRDDAQQLYNELLALQPIVDEIGRLREKEIKELLEDIEELMAKDSSLRDQKDQVRLDFSVLVSSFFFFFVIAHF
jgi:hypothetical protein